jgi:cytochrome c biogenesis protein CcdA
MTPLGKVANYHKLWLKSAVAYTVAGCFSAALVGVVLGTIGSALPWESSRLIAFYLIGFLSLLLAAREWGWIAFALPERKLQSERVWVHSFGFVTASVMWGLHIGLGFATRITYGGFWVLVAIAVVVGEPIYGAILMLAYWMGRALPVWVAPSLIASDEEAVELSERVFTDELVYHRVVAIALVWSAVVIVLFAHWVSFL